MQPRQGLASSLICTYHLLSQKEPQTKTMHVTKSNVLYRIGLTWTWWYHRCHLRIENLIIMPGSITTGSIVSITLFPKGCSLLLDWRMSRAKTAPNISAWRTTLDCICQWHTHTLWATPTPVTAWSLYAREQQACTAGDKEDGEARGEAALLAGPQPCLCLGIQTCTMS